MKTIEEQIKVMTAFSQGQEVEVFLSGQDKWKTTKTPLWNWSEQDYRIKEKEEVIYIEKWLCEYKRCENLEGSQRFTILEKVVPFDVRNAEKIKLLGRYEVKI